MIEGVVASRSLGLKFAAEVFLLAAVVPVVATDVIGSNGGSSGTFAALNALVGLLGWKRPLVVGWLCVILAGLVTLMVLFSDAFMDVSRLALAGIVALFMVPPLVVGALFIAAARATPDATAGGRGV